MKNPFQIHKTFKTELSHEEIFSVIKKKLHKSNTALLMTVKEYEGFAVDNSFRIYKRFDRRWFRYPEIHGRIISQNPSLVEIKISARYFKMAFFLAIGFLMIISSILIDSMKINGVLREPNFVERLFFAMFGILVGLIQCYNGYSEIRYSERWIKEELKLEE